MPRDASLSLLASLSYLHINIIIIMVLFYLFIQYYAVHININ